MPLLWNEFPQNDEIEKSISKGLKQEHQIDVIVAGENFEDLVRSHPGYESFSAGRSGGGVGGKTIPTGNGLIILNMPVLLTKGLDCVERVTCHEVGHVLTYKNGDLQKAGSPPERIGDADFRAMASMVLDEFRAEKYVVESGYQIQLASEHLITALHDTNLEFINVLMADDITIKDLGQTAFSLLNAFIKQLSIYIARDRGLIFLREFDYHTKHLWSSVMRGLEGDLTSLFARVPSSKHRATRLDQYIDELGEVLRQAMAAWGLELVEQDGYPQPRKIVDTDSLRERFTLSTPFFQAQFEAETPTH